MRNAIGGIVVGFMCSCLPSKTVVGMQQDWKCMRPKIELAILNDNTDELSSLISRTNYPLKEDIKFLAETASNYGSINVVKFLIMHGLPEALSNQEEALYLYFSAIAGGNLDVINLLAPYVETTDENKTEGALKAIIAKFGKDKVLSNAILSCNFNVIRWVAENLPKKDYTAFDPFPFLPIQIGFSRSLEQIKELFKVITSRRSRELVGCEQSQRLPIILT